MSPATHLLASWVLANIGGLSRRERTAVTVAGTVPDIDAFGLIPEVLSRGSAHPLLWFSEYHHVLTHNLAFGLLISGACLAVAKRRSRTATLALLSFHLHLLGDLAGARGPDGYQWPIFYLFPLSNAWQWTWEGQWAFNAWPNFLTTAIVLAMTFFLTWKRGHSPLEMLSSSVDEAFVQTLRRRFPRQETLQS